MLHSSIPLIVALLLCLAAAKLYAQDTQTYATAKKDGAAASKRAEDAPANVLSPEEWLLGLRRPCGKSFEDPP